MSKLIRVDGDLVKMAKASEFDVIVHGCNCFNTMGAGIAKQIADEFPSAYAADQQTIRGDITKLGNWSLVPHQLPNSNAALVIINAYTQYNISAGEDVFEYEAFHLILTKLANLASNCIIGMPYIGMGLAGGDEKRIIAMMEQFAEDAAYRGNVVKLVRYVK